MKPIHGTAGGTHARSHGRPTMVVALVPTLVLLATHMVILPIQLWLWRLMPALALREHGQLLSLVQQLGSKWYVYINVFIPFNALYSSMQDASSTAGAGTSGLVTNSNREPEGSFLQGIKFIIG